MIENSFCKPVGQQVQDMLHVPIYLNLRSHNKAKRFITLLLKMKSYLHISDNREIRKQDRWTNQEFEREKRVEMVRMRTSKDDKS